MNPQDIVQGAAGLSKAAEALANQAAVLAMQANQLAAPEAGHGGTFMSLVTVFVLACFVGYYVVWRVTPALHSPLMAVTNAISSVIIVGGLMAASTDLAAPKSWGFLSVMLASVNIFGGFIVTGRMVAMFRKKQK